MNFKKYIPAAALVILLIAFRLAAVYIKDFPPNFQPIASLFFCGVACFGLRSIWVPLLAWFISYPLTSGLQGHGWHSITERTTLSFLVLSFLAIILLAKKFRNKPPLHLLAGSLIGAVLFYLITNFACWIIDPRYLKTLTGFIQAMWTGIPTEPYPPTWVFFKNSIISNFLYTSLFLGATFKLFEPSSETEDADQEQAEA